MGAARQGKHLTGGNRFDKNQRRCCCGLAGNESGLDLQISSGEAFSSIPNSADSSLMPDDNFRLEGDSILGPPLAMV
jgi:hypothetical protein